jgi:hypothetical protein
MSDQRDNVLGLLASLSATKPNEDVSITRTAELRVPAGEVIDLLGESTARALTHATIAASSARRAARRGAVNRENTCVRGTLRLVKGGAS